MLEAKALSFCVGERRLINEVSLTLDAGEFVAIIGPNGAGKSTLLRMLTGYITPTQGQCLFLGKPIQSWDSAFLARKRAVMRQNCQMSFPFTVQEVIEMGGFPNKCRLGKEQKRHIEEVVAQTECQSLLNRDFRQLSGGEQQRVQLTRVLIQLWGDDKHSQRWLFLDEPTSAFDLYYQQQTLRLLKKLTQERAFSVCCILHDLNLAALYADRIALLHQGRLVIQGKPEEILQEALLKDHYLVDLGVMPHPENQLPQVYLRQ